MIRLKFERTRRGISQEALGTLARVHQPDIAQIELGRLIPRVAVLERLGRVLDVPPDQLLKPVEIIKPETSEVAR